MHIARDRMTGGIVEAQYLRTHPPAHGAVFTCHGCTRQVTAVGILPGRRVTPHFAARHEHDEGCEEQAYRILVRQAATRSVATPDGELPVSYPDRLELATDDSDGVTAGAGDLTGSAAGGHRSTDARARAGTRWGARTIMPICRVFLDFPFDRDRLRLNLREQGVHFETYGRAFWRLDWNTIRGYGEARIFYAPLRWKIPPGVSSTAMTLTLNAGAREEKRLVRPYQIRFDWEAWPTGQRKYLSQAIEDGRQDTREAFVKAARSGGTPPSDTPRWRDQTDAWMFFVGVQDPADASLFVVTDHRLACCIHGRLRTPIRP